MSDFDIPLASIESSPVNFPIKEKPHGRFPFPAISSAVDPNSSKVDQTLRDLRWVIESASLINPAGREDVADPQWDPDFPIDDSHLVAFMEKRTSHRVGYYFENLIHFWLREIREVEIIEQGKQIIEEGITKGEIDFIFRDELGRTVHWEVAVKFYLKTQPASTDGSHLIGPNATDNFAKKNSRLFGRQLELSRRLSDPIDLRQGFVKGRIFYHPEDASVANTPASLNPEHLCGKWLRESEIHFLEHPTKRYRMLEKPYWLAEELGSQEDLPWTEFRKLLQVHFKKSPHPQLLIACDEIDGVWRECERIFVVPDHWPDRAPSKIERGIGS